jgi:hypothetical protein
MPDDDWVTVAQYSGPMSAAVAGGLLTGLAIPNRVSVWPRSSLCDIWVPPEFAEEAKKALEQGSVSDQDLTKLALSYPPPEDASPQSQADDSSSAISNLPAGRQIPFLTPTLGVLAVLFDTLFFYALHDLQTRGDHIICRVTGCRSFAVSLVLLGLFAAVLSLVFMGSLINRK